jgi:hypothetical protein
MDVRHDTAAHAASIPIGISVKSDPLRWSVILTELNRIRQRREERQSSCRITTPSTQQLTPARVLPLIAVLSTS